MRKGENPFKPKMVGEITVLKKHLKDHRFTVKSLFGRMKNPPFKKEFLDKIVNGSTVTRKQGESIMEVINFYEKDGFQMKMLKPYLFTDLFTENE